MLTKFTLCITWFPWVSFWYDSFFLQLLICYTIFLLYQNVNLYYNLLYLFISIILFGIVLGILQVDFFTGFLWVIEFTIIFISILLLFYLNTTGVTIYKVNNVFNFSFFFSFFIFQFFSLNYEVECILPIVFNTVVLWDDYYEALNNTNINDFTAFTIGYYFINNLSFLIVGFLLLIGSVICVNLNKSQTNLKIFSINSFLTIFDFFKNFINFRFFRKQDLVKQAVLDTTIRSFKRKV